MAYSRKLSDKKIKDLQLPKDQTLITTKTSFRPSSSRVSTANKQKFQECLEKMEKLSKQVESLSVQSLDKDVSQVLRQVADSNRGVLISQKLVGFREATILIARMNQILKKKTKQMNQQNSALTLNAYKNISQELNSITKQEKSDQLVLQSNIVPSVIGVLQSFVSKLQSEAALNKERKPLMMRKHSLKKVAQGNPMRPKSRGKLSSLSKKQKNMVMPIEPIQLSLTKKGTQTFINTNETGMSPTQQIIHNTCCTLKNLSANKKVRRDLLKQQYLRLLNRYLSIWNDKNISQYGTTVLVQITSCFRHLVAQEKSYKIFLKSNCFEPWTKLIQTLPTSNDLIFNILRILSKLSAYQDCCEKINQRKQCLKTLSSFLKVYKAHIHIVIRVAFIFANMTSYREDIRNQLYFDFNAWEDIYTCFEHYATSELKGKNQVQKMGISMAAWDYKAMKKQSDIEALMKIIRLIANIITVPEIGQHIYHQHFQNYKDLIKQLKSLLATRTSIEKYNQLIACVLSCLTNILYYDRQALLANNEYKQVKKQLIQVLVDFVAQVDNQQICCESLRVISNLTRMKQFVRPVLDVKINEAVMILLDSTSKEIVYYSLGIIINLCADENFKNNNKQDLINTILSILSECQSEDFDIVTVSLKALSIIMEGNTVGIDPKQLTEIENCLVSLGSNCDQVLMIPEADRSEIQSAQQSRNLINVLLNNMPQQKFTCPVKNCGRKFADQAKLQEHISRRHKIS